MGDGTPLPLWISGGILLYFLADPVLGWREGRDRRDRGAFGSSWLFFVSAGAILAMLGSIWAAEGGHLAGHVETGDLSIYRWSSASLAGGLILGIGVGLLARGRSDRHALGSLLPPMATLAGLCFVGAEADRLLGGRYGSQFGLGWLAVAVGGIAAAGLFLGWVQQRLSGRRTLAVGMACAALWATASLKAYTTITPFHHLCYVTPSVPAARETIAGIVAAMVCLAIGLRWIAGRKRRHVDRVQHRRRQVPLGGPGAIRLPVDQRAGRDDTPGI